MASQVLIDFSNIGEQIVTAIKSSIEKVSEQLIAKTAVGNPTKDGDTGFDIREQILANARVLWPIVERKNPSWSLYRGTRQLPELTVILDGVGTTIKAEVVRGAPDKKEKYIFIRTEDVNSVEKALQSLLEITMTMLNEVRSTSLLMDTAHEWVNVKGKGGYYMPK